MRFAEKFRIIIKGGEREAFLNSLFGAKTFSLPAEWNFLP